MIALLKHHHSTVRILQLYSLSKRCQSSPVYSPVGPVDQISSVCPISLAGPISPASSVDQISSVCPLSPACPISPASPVGSVSKCSSVALVSPVACVVEFGVVTPLGPLYYFSVKSY